MNRTKNEQRGNFCLFNQHDVMASLNEAIHVWIYPVELQGCWWQACCLLTVNWTPTNKYSTQQRPRWTQLGSLEGILDLTSLRKNKTNKQLESIPRPETLNSRGEELDMSGDTKKVQTSAINSNSFYSDGELANQIYSSRRVQVSSWLIVDSQL